MTEKANFEPPNEGNAIPPHPNSILLVDMYLKKKQKTKNWGFPGGAKVKKLPANAEDVRDEGLIPGLGRSSEGGMATHSSILAGRTPWTEEPGGL